MPEKSLYNSRPDTKVSHSSVSKIIAGGLELDVYGLTEYQHRLDNLKGSNSLPKLAVVFLMHGRMGKKQDMTIFAHRLCEINHSSSSLPRHLLVVAFDSINHGSRTLDKSKNLAWANGNTTHALDMWATIYGTALDIVRLMDVLPAYLLPPTFSPTTIDKWSVIGVSQGGHLAYIVGYMDPRISLVIPIIGTSHYASLLMQRLKESRMSTQKYYPKSFASTIARHDAIYHIPSFRTKELLILKGANDTLVPPELNEDFEKKLRMIGGNVKVITAEGVGHELVEGFIVDTVGCVRNWIMKDTLEAKL